MSPSLRAAACAALILMAGASPALPDDDIALTGTPAVAPTPRSADAPDQFGGNWSIKVIPGNQFVGVNSSSTFTFVGNGYFTAAAGGSYWTPIDMEPGTEVAEACVFAFDLSPNTISIQWGIYHLGDATGLPGFVNLGNGSTVGTPGYTIPCVGPGMAAPVKIRAFADVDGDGTPDYNWHRLSIISPVDGNLQWGGAYIRWRRSIAPGPAVATYPNDVPTSSPIFRFVEALSAAGITAGCGPGSYCPNDPLTRGQMAVFLTAALGLYWPQ